MAQHKLLTRARKEGTPLIDGNRATFVWQGEAAPQLLGDFNGWGYMAPPVNLQQEGRGVWAHTLKLDPAAYIEYAYFTDIGEGERVPDPFNKRHSSNGIGSHNHYFDMPASRHTTLFRPRRDVARGKVTQHLLSHSYLLAGAKRDVWLYRPPSVSTPNNDPVPLVVVYDGNDYLRRQNIHHIIDNLIAQGRIRPLALALLGNGKQARLIEYTCSETTLAWVVGDVLELAQQELNLLDLRQHPGAYGVLGASMGGLMALYTALRLPLVFGNVLSQSGAFTLEIMKQPALINTMVEHFVGEPLNIWMDCGMYEFLIAANREMYPLLKSKGHQVTYREYAGGHNIISWRDELPHAFESMFPLQG